MPLNQKSSTQPSISLSTSRSDTVGTKGSIRESFVQGLYSSSSIVLCPEGAIMNHRRLLVLGFLLWFQDSHALVPFVQLTNPLTQASEKIPSSFVENWNTWVYTFDNNTWDNIPSSTTNGFLNPYSLEELWLPRDLILPKLHLAVGLHVRNGVPIPRHVFPALDVALPGSTFRNRGLCSVPRARVWMDYKGLLDCRMVLKTRPLSDEDNDQPWETLLEVSSIQDTVERGITALTEEPPSELLEGSALVHIGVCSENETAIDCPEEGELQVLLLEDETVMAELQVAIRSTAAGSDSQYLPDAYKPLYEDYNLRRPGFAPEAK